MNRGVIAAVAALVASLMPIVGASADTDTTRVVFVAGSAPAPSGDRPAVERLTADGYDVVVVDDDHLAPASWAGADLMVVSSSVVPATAAPRIADVDLPLVTWEPYIYPALGMTSGAGTDRGELSSTGSIAIVDDDHPLAAGRTGTVAISTAPGLSWGRPGGSADVVATVPGDATRAVLFAYEDGSPMASGTAPARRVALFPTYGSGKALNQHGLALVSGAASWALGPATPPPPPTNQPPVVGVQSGRVTVPAEAELRATVVDDGLPEGSTTSVAWEQVGGPPVTIAAPDAPVTTAYLEEPGTYLFRAQASDGELVGEAVATITAVVEGAPARATDGLVAAWDFTEGAGPTVFDRAPGVAGANDLAIVDPSRVRWVAGGGLEVASATRLVTDGAPLSNALAATDQVTLEAWVTPAQRAPATPGRVAALARDQNARSLVLSQGFFVGKPTNVWSTRHRTTGHYNNPLDGGTPLTTRPMHLVLRRQPSGRSELLVDGVVVAARATSGTFDTWDRNLDLALADDTAGGRPWLGTFWHVALYDRALTDEEVALHRHLGPLAADTRPPVITSVEVDDGVETAVVRWTTDEATTGGVTVGGLSASSPRLATSHVAIVDRLPPGPHEVVVEAADASANAATPATAAASLGPDPEPPVVDVWYGDDQPVGGRGLPQRWFNVVGRVSDPQGVQVLAATIGGGPSRRLSIGPDGRRLARPGDFNLDVLVSDLAEGPNEVVFAAVDGGGAVAVRRVTVRRLESPGWSLPTTVDWLGAAVPNDVAQVVDGLHRVEGDRLVVALDDTGYDRLVALGDTSWRDVEVLVSVTFDGFSTTPGPLSGKPGFGIIARWNGHNDTVSPGSQPLQGYLPDPTGATPTPFGAIAWYRNGRLGILDHRAQPVLNGSALAITPGRTYRLRLRVTTSGSRTTYRFRFWDTAVPEPAAWSLTWTSPGGADEPSTGSVVLVAHEAAVRWGPVTVGPA